MFGLRSVNSEFYCSRWHPSCSFRGGGGRTVPLENPGTMTGIAAVEGWPTTSLFLSSSRRWAIGHRWMGEVIAGSY